MSDLTGWTWFKVEVLGIMVRPKERDPFEKLPTKKQREAYRNKLLEGNSTDPKDVYEAYREKVTHEDTLINFRSSWFVTLQAFLFTSFALSLGKFDGATAQFAPFLFGGIGFAACIATFMSVRAAHMAIEKITNKWMYPYEDKKGQVDLKIGVKHIVDPDGIFPAIKGGGSNTNIARLGSVSSFWLPVVVSLFWVAFLVLAYQDWKAMDTSKSEEQVCFEITGQPNSICFGEASTSKQTKGGP